MRHLPSSVKCSTGEKQRIRVENYFVNPDQKVRFNPHAFKNTCDVWTLSMGYGNVLLFIALVFRLVLNSVNTSSVIPTRAHCTLSSRLLLKTLFINCLTLTYNQWSANTLQSPLSLNWLNNKLSFTAVMIHL